MSGRAILLTGGTGFIGPHLVKALVAQGDNPIVLVRDMAAARRKLGAAVALIDHLDAIRADLAIDGVVNLAGAPLAAGRWTEARKRDFESSRFGTTEALVALMARLERKPEVLVSGSAVGFYGDGGDEILTEGSPSQPIFMSELCVGWEARARAAEALGVRVCLIRTGLVLGRDGGALPPLARATRFGAGSIMGTGAQCMPWIHIADMVQLLLFALEHKDIAGPINAAAPRAVTQEVFSRALGRALHRPVLLRLPRALLRLLLGEMSDLFLVSERVSPKRALEAGFSFRFTSIEAGFADLFGG